MYFKDKNNTNIDNQFNDNKISKIMTFFSKYKILIIISLIIFIGVIILPSFFNNNLIDENVINYLILNGEEKITLYEGTDYIEPGYEAYNSNDEDLTSSVDIKSNLNTNIVGEYEITYTIDDITKTRIITIIEKPKQYTYIYLKTINNDINVYLNINEDYIEPGYQVFSSTGENLTDKVQVYGDVDTSKKGNYKLIYSVTDMSGVTVTASRMIIVMDTEINLSLNTEEYTNRDIMINVRIIDQYFDYMILPDNTKVSENVYSYSVSENGKYTFTAYSTRGIKKESIIEVKNIDKMAPNGNCSGSYKNGISTINISAIDNVKVKKYEINGKEYIDNNIIIEQELESVIIKIYDIAGNTRDISCSLKNNNTSSPDSSSKPSSSSSSSKPSSSSSSRPSSSSNSSSNSNQNSGPIEKTKNISVNMYKNFTYWLYVPDKSKKSLPIVVYLPGKGERGNDYKTGASTGIKYGPINEIRDHNYSYNAIVVHMQVPQDDIVNNYIKDYISLLNNIVSEYGANKNKISIIGFSHGCYGLVDMLQKYPKYFSAAVFVGCAPNKRIDINNFIHQPVRTFVGSGDGRKETNTNYSLEKFVSNINSSGGDAKYIDVSSKHNKHNIMNDSYSILRDSDYNVINWMISKSK